MPPELILSDEEYASEEDSDFAPNAVPAQEGAESSDEESGADEPASIVKANSRGKPSLTKRKHVDAGAEEAEDAGFENSGDEAIMERGLKKQRRKGRKGDLEDEEGGEGGLVKTRSMRAQEKAEKKPLVDTSAATVDVDALWTSMISGKPAPAVNPIPTIEEHPAILSPKDSLFPPIVCEKARSPSTTFNDGPNSMIMIKRTFKFAGKLTTEQKLVPRNSAEAKLYLASQPDPSSTSIEQTSQDPFTKPKRPPKKARRSLFEPITVDLPQRTDLHFGIRKDMEDLALVGEATGTEKKLNTVEKSAMDWAGFVDKEGIKDELDAAGKSKGAYKSRQEFLARVEDKKEEEHRRVRGL